MWESSIFTGTPPGTLLCSLLYYFHSHLRTLYFVPFPNSHVPTLVSVFFFFFVETGLQQYTKFQELFYRTALLSTLSLYFSEVKNKDTLDLKKITN